MTETYLILVVTLRTVDQLKRSLWLRLDLLTVRVGSVPVRPGSVPQANRFARDGSDGRISSIDLIRFSEPS